MTKTRKGQSKRRPLLIDTNLWLVMIIGAVDEGRYIERSKRLGDFCWDDYVTLWDIFKKYEEVWITPYIAAEVSNLIDLKGEARDRAFAIARELFSKLVQTTSVIKDDCANDFFIAFGLTDSSIIKLSEQVDILTNDHRMLGPLHSVRGARVITYAPVKTS